MMGRGRDVRVFCDRATTDDHDGDVDDVVVVDVGPRDVD